MRKTTKVKKLTNAIKRFVTQTPETTPPPDLDVTLALFATRLEALERKTDLILGQLAGLTRDEHRALYSSQKVKDAPGAARSPNTVRPPSPSAAPLRSPEAAFVNRDASPSQRTGRRERLLHRAVCADCRKDCEVPVKPTEGRPVYCKPCFALRKANQSLPGKNVPRPNASVSGPQGQGMEASPPSQGMAQAGTPQGTHQRGAGHVPPQVHNQARRNAVAYMAKKAGHLPETAKPVLPAADATPPPAAKSVRSRSGRREGAQKRRNR